MFWDDIIKHELPNVDIDPGNTADPRTERFVPPPSDPSCEELKEWENQFLFDWKHCGEAFHRHVCEDVCHKYNNEHRCRFRFPHELERDSKYDRDSNSIIFAVRDSWVNCHNPCICVACRHNHDLRCILSGKSAEAAMFYITDYITKMDLKTYQVLSLLSKAILMLKENDKLASTRKADGTTDSVSTSSSPTIN